VHPHKKIIQVTKCIQLCGINWGLFFSIIRWCARCELLQNKEMKNFSILFHIFHLCILPHSSFEHGMCVCSGSVWFMALLKIAPLHLIVPWGWGIWNDFLTWRNRKEEYIVFQYFNEKASSEIESEKEWRKKHLTQSADDIKEICGCLQHYIVSEAKKWDCNQKNLQEHITTLCAVFTSSRNRPCFKEIKIILFSYFPFARFLFFRQICVTFPKPYKGWKTFLIFLYSFSLSLLVCFFLLASMKLPKLSSLLFFYSYQRLLCLKLDIFL
jgi:hypothetical protein